MHFAIIDVASDGFRSENVSRIRELVDLQEVTDIPFVNGRVGGVEWIEDGLVGINGVSLGEMGAFASTIEALRRLRSDDAIDELLLFENDAILTEDFMAHLNSYRQEVPRPFDAFSLCAARRDDFLYDERPDVYSIGEPNVCRAYQNWPSNAILYSKAGARKALETFERDRTINCTIDVWIYERAGLDVYTVKPSAKRVVGRYLGPSTANLSWTGWDGDLIEW